MLEMVYLVYPYQSWCIMVSDLYLWSFSCLLFGVSMVALSERGNADYLV